MSRFSAADPSALLSPSGEGPYPLAWLARPPAPQPRSPCLLHLLKLGQTSVPLHVLFLPSTLPFPSSACPVDREFILGCPAPQSHLMLSRAVQPSPPQDLSGEKSPRSNGGGCQVQDGVRGRRVGSRGSGALFIFVSSRVLLLLLLT